MKVKWCKLLLHLHQLLGRVDWIQWWQWHLRLHSSLETLTTDALYTRGRHDSLHRVESILKVAMNRLNFLLEAIVRSTHLHWLRMAAVHHLPGHRHRHLHLHLHSFHLLLEVFDKSRLHHVDAVVALDLLTVVEKELLVATKLILYGLYRHLIDGLADL